MERPKNYFWTARGCCPCFLGPGTDDKTSQKGAGRARGKVWVDHCRSKSKHDTVTEFLWANKDYRDNQPHFGNTNLHCAKRRGDYMSDRRHEGLGYRVRIANPDVKPCVYLIMSRALAWVSVEPWNRWKSSGSCSGHHCWCSHGPDTVFLQETSMNYWWDGCIEKRDLPRRELLLLDWGELEWEGVGSGAGSGVGMFGYQRL